MALCIRHKTKSIVIFFIKFSLQYLSFVDCFDIKASCFEYGELPFLTWSNQRAGRPKSERRDNRPGSRQSFRRRDLGLLQGGFRRKIYFMRYGAPREITYSASKRLHGQQEHQSQKHFTANASGISQYSFSRSSISISLPVVPNLTLPPDIEEISKP